MDLQGAAPVPLPHSSPSVVASSHHRHLDPDSSDLASPSTSSGATAQLTPDKDPNSPSSSSSDDGETLWADDDVDGQHHIESGFVASYELQNLGNHAGRKSARNLDEEEEGEGYVPNGVAPQRRLSDSTAASFQLYTPDEEQAVVRKFDRKLVLFLSVCYMLSFIDRSSMLSPFTPKKPLSDPSLPLSLDLVDWLTRRNVDIGNARIAGMENDLQSRPPHAGWYEWSLTSFYISYISFEWMSLLWRVIPAHIYVSRAGSMLTIFNQPRWH